MMRLRRLVALALVTACGGGGTGSTYGPGKVEIPAADGSRKAKDDKSGERRESPPPSGATKASPFPAVGHAKLANGMELAVVTSRALPIVQMRLLVRAGSGAGKAPGIAELTAQMLKDGGTRAMSSAELLRRVETLGANLSVSTDFDGTVLSMGVTKDMLDEALSLLSQVVREPRFDESELRKLKARTTDEAEDAARSNGTWTASWLVFRELFGEAHPYGTYGLLPSQIAKVTSAHIRDFHRRFFVPKAATLVLAGDIDDAAAKAAAEKTFGAWTGGEPPKVDVPPIRALDKTRVIVAHRKRSVQSDVLVAMIAPPRKSEEWAHVRVANQVLGGGVASRLFADVREQRSLAYRTNAQVLELSRGEQPLVLYAGTQTDKTQEALAGLLENAAKMTSAPPTAEETATARRYLSDVFAIRMETIGAIADMVVTQESFGLPNGYWDVYRKAIRATEPADAARAAKKMYASGNALVVISGDADVVAPALAKTYEVTVVDPEQEFKVLKTLPPASDGTR
jgi:zinc protease